MLIACERRWRQLDDVDLGRQVAGDFEANFLLTNLRLAPNFHGVLSYDLSASLLLIGTRSF